MFLFAKKSLGQHFLNSKHVLEQIIESANIKKGELVLEIGPGTGILTEALLNTGAKVITVEKDDRAIELLRSKFQTSITKQQLTLIHGDVLEDSSNCIPNEPYLIVANIPYYITGAILEKFLENDRKPNRMILLVQKEVADRITTKDDKESILSISVKAFGTPKIVAKVPRGAFTPPPNVDSAILAIENISDKLFKENNVQISSFFAVVKAGFAHKRKYTISNLGEIMDKNKLAEIWNTLKIDPKIRSEKMTLENWINISKHLNRPN
ncbi:MAG: 16S rRNA (adenine(1518)-N(6)/adenine(1519)-N(6))-dimethyltransferase RsmA [Candidatus Paceibacterota bacterium]